MLSLAKARKDYYLQKLGEVSPREDYYLKGGSAIGQWHGAGASENGLQGRVTAEGLVRLFDGQHPETGEQLGRSLRKDGVAAWDLTFSADKSVSLLWALGGDEVRQQVREAFDEATTEALSYLEGVASSTRGGRRVPVLDSDGVAMVDEHGRPRLRVETWPIRSTGYVAARFTEFSSRADDPQLHTHVVVANRVKGVDGVWRTLDGRFLYRHKLAAGYIHEAELRARLTERLGVRWQPVEQGMADIDGITREQIMAFSRRRQQIDSERETQGLDDTSANNELLALATRTPKTDRSLADLMVEWSERADTIGLTPDIIAKLLDRSRQVSIPDPLAVAAKLMSETGLTAEASTFGKAEVIQEASAAFPEGGTRQQVEALADSCLSNREVVPILRTNTTSLTTAEPVFLPDPTVPEPSPDPEEVFMGLVHERRYSTAGLLAVEQRIIRRAMDGINAGRWTAPKRKVIAALNAHPDLTEGQRQLVERFATSSSSVDVASGAAGTGKSTALAVLADLAGETGTPILGTALAAKASSGFESATGIPSTTLTRLIGDATDHGLPRGAIVVVDEAGMVGTRQLARLSDLVETASGKLILVGDHHQLPEIQAGGLFRALTNRLPAVELIENVRQTEEWERDALTELRTGNPARAVAMYRNRGRILTTDTPDEAIQLAVANWHRDVEAAASLSDVLLIAHRNSTVNHLNEQARSLTAAKGRLSGPTVNGGGRMFRAGDRVLCQRNRTRLGVVNGDLATVTSADPSRRTLTIRLDRNGETRTIPAWYLDEGYIDYGYAVTGHKAQGATARVAHCVAEPGVDREWIYVTMSRGRQANILYLADTSALDHEHDNDCDHLSHQTHSQPLHGLMSSLNRRGAQHAAIDMIGH